MGGGTENESKEHPYFLKKDYEPTCASVHFPHLLMLFLALVPHPLASPVKI